MTDVLTQFDSWFSDEGPAALTIIEPLQSALEGETAIFPPTYAPEQGSSDKKSEYVIDTLKDGRKICQVDSVGAQANRLEPIFKLPGFSELVPQVVVKVDGGQSVNVLDAGHRAADAIVRFSSLKEDLAKAFQAWQTGDASTLAKIAPTSLVFGAWDSRGTQAKTPRILSSIIRAYDVELLTRSAQYIPPLEYTDEVLGEAASLTDDQRSEFGLTHVPAPKALGGVLVKGGIRREASLNLVSLRALGAVEHGRLDSDKTLSLRRYVLGLALVAITKPLAHNLRQGCLLVGVENEPAQWKLVYANGRREAFQVGHDRALDYARQAAQAFRDTFGLASTDGGGFEPVTGKFDPNLARASADEKTAKKGAAKAKKTRDKVAGAAASKGA